MHMAALPTTAQPSRSACTVLRDGDDRDVDEVLDPAAACGLTSRGVRTNRCAEFVGEVVGDGEDAVMRPDEPSMSSGVSGATMSGVPVVDGAHNDIDVEACEGGRAEARVDRNAGSSALFLEMRDAGDIEGEMIAEVELERGT